MKIEGENNMGESFFWKDKAKGILQVELFSAMAENAAKKIAQSKDIILDKRNKETFVNAPSFTQLRKFYNEVLCYKTKIEANEGDFDKYLPYVRMINAKLTYANAKGNITKDCLNFFKARINEIFDIKDFYAFADFFEAFIAFYRQYSSK